MKFNINTKTLSSLLLFSQFVSEKKLLTVYTISFNRNLLKFNFISISLNTVQVLQVYKSETSSPNRITTNQTKCNTKTFKVLLAKSI